MDIYIKSAAKCAMAEREHILLKDIAEVVAEATVVSKLNTLKVLDIREQKKQSFLVSITDIIRVIQKEYPTATINNVGAEDTLIDYNPQKSKDSRVWKCAKVVFISLVLLMGAATAIMSFYTDAEIGEIFKQFHFLVYGMKTDKPRLIQVSYSIGLAVGIVVFFNNFAGKKITADPTPIEVEMSLYESDVTETMIDTLNTERKNAGKHGGNA